MAATRKLQKRHQIKILTKTQVSQPWEKIEKILEQNFKSYEENINSYLAVNNKFLSERINKLNGKLNDLQVSI